jgi:hypothetical protein
MTRTGGASLVSSLYKSGGRIRRLLFAYIPSSVAGQSGKGNPVRRRLAARGVLSVT